jgi:hypothetical protein
VAFRVTMGSGEQTPYTGAIPEMPQQHALSFETHRSLEPGDNPFCVDGRLRRRTISRRADMALAVSANHERMRA